MKILILSDGIPPYIMGGMQRHTVNLVKYLVNSEVEVKLIHCFDHGAKKPTEEEVNQEIFGQDKVDGFSTLAIEFPKPGKIPGHYIRRSYSYSKQIFELVRSQIDDFDFVYIKGFAGWKLLEQKNFYSTKMGVNFHGYEMFQPPINIKTRINNQILITPVNKSLKMADYVFSYGAGVTDLLKSIEIPEEKIVSINGAIDDIWFEPISVTEVKSPIKLLFVGRFERRKGVEELNSVFPSFLDSNFEMTFVGPIPEVSQVHHPKVNYLGPVHDVSEIKSIYAKHDILLAPSYSEGMPNVIMEAMSCGLAVLATNVGATSLLVDSTNGWLMPSMSSDQLRKTLEELKKESIQSILSKKRRSKVKLDDQFSWKKVAEKHKDFFSSL